MLVLDRCGQCASHENLTTSRCFGAISSIAPYFWHCIVAWKWSGIVKKGTWAVEKLRKECWEVQCIRRVFPRDGPCFECCFLLFLHQLFVDGIHRHHIGTIWEQVIHSIKSYGKSLVNAKKGRICIYQTFFGKKQKVKFNFPCRFAPYDPQKRHFPKWNFTNRNLGFGKIAPYDPALSVLKKIK